jgi:hypothetical protein
MARCGSATSDGSRKTLEAPPGGPRAALDGPPDWEFTMPPLTVSGGVGTEGGYPDGIP